MSNKGTSTFIMQRTSAVLLIPLVLWFLWSVIAHAGQDYAATRVWMGQLHNTLLLGGLVTIGAFHMPKGDVIDRISELDPHLKTVVHCRTWGRSSQVVEVLQYKGFTDIYNLDVGIHFWIDDIDPTLEKV